MDYPVYNQNAEKVGQVSLPDSVFGVPMNKDLLHQVRGGGIKPWKQKGTGRARHGSIRSPIWKGGGVTFGPRKERNFKKKINKNMARRALSVALSSKVKDKEFIVIDSIHLSNWKTKEMAGMIKNIKPLFPVKHGSILLVIPSKLSDTIERVAKNLPKVDVMEARNLNALDIMARKNLLVIKDAVNMVGDFNK